MGTILTVHGTYAHLDIPGSSDDSASSTAYWWRPDSPFANEIRSLVKCADDGDVEVTPFVWSGENSERERRAAGRALYQELIRLDEEGKPFCVIAHSHGGSVLSAALLEAAARKNELPNLNRWMTVGTPFVELRRERFLFMRLSILLKAMYVASLMLLVIFIGATIGDLADGEIEITDANSIWRLGISAVAASLPFIVFLIIVTVRERRRRFFNRPRVKQRARLFFADRWLALTHDSDEAVRGLGTLRNVDLPIFDKQFAVPFLGLLSVFMLPAVYLVAIYSPALMVNLTEVLRTRVYELDQLEARTEQYRQARSATRGIFRDLRRAREIASDDMRSIEQQMNARKIMRERRVELRRQRDILHEAYPDLPRLQRALRFKRNFLETRNGLPCNQGRLCGEGRNKALNSKLLLHLVTDELSSLFVDEEVQRGTVGRLAGYILPIVLVPIIFGLFAICWVFIAQALARVFSSVVSGWLDRMTWAQVRRTAVGNDTDDEVAVGTAPYPIWIGTKRPFLPLEVSSAITEFSNEATFRSLGKFRAALSEFAFLEAGERRNGDNLLAYLNWNELIHTTYFFVPSFTRLVAFSVAETDGFKSSPDLTQGGSEDDLRVWLSELEPSGKKAA